MKKFLKSIQAWWKQRFCAHRFTSKEWLDLNVDPRCTRCGRYHSVINRQKRKRGIKANDQEFKLIR